MAKGQVASTEGSLNCCPVGASVPTTQEHSEDTALQQRPQAWITGVLAGSLELPH